MDALFVVQNFEKLISNLLSEAFNRKSYLLWDQSNKSKIRVTTLESYFLVILRRSKILSDVENYSTSGHGLSFFPITPCVSPRQGIWLTRPNPSAQTESTIYWVPVQQMEPSCPGLMHVRT